MEPSELQIEDEISEINLGRNDNEKYAISKIMDSVKQLAGAKHLHPRITFLDFAGHCMNYAFHKNYFSQRTCYILVVDMTKRFDEHVAAADTNEKAEFNPGPMAVTLFFISYFC